MRSGAHLAAAAAIVLAQASCGSDIGARRDDGADDPAWLDGAALSLDGRLDEARDVLEVALAEQPGDAQSRFVLACVELAAGQPAAAHRHVARLPQDGPWAADVEVLGMLAAEVERDPDGSWIDRTLAAWRSAGCPALSEHPFDLDWDLPLERTQAAGRARLRGTPAAEIARGSRHRAVHDRAEAVARLEALGVTDVDEPPLDLLLFVAAEAPRGPLARSLYEAAARRRPASLVLRLAAALAGSDRQTPFDTAELDSIEAALGAPGDPTLWGDLYRSLRGRLRDSGPVASRAAAFMAGAYPSLGIMELVLRAKRRPTEPGDPLRDRLRRLAARAGERLLSGPTLLDRMVGGALLRNAAEAMGPDVAPPGAPQAADAPGRLMTVFRRYRYVGSWPIQGLAVEMYDVMGQEEMAHITRVADVCRTP